MIGEKIQSADWKTEKHVSVIDCPAQVKAGEVFAVTATIGKEIAHPNTTEHHIRWIALYFHRSQYNRLVREHRDAIVAFFLHLVELLRARQVPYEVLDTSGVPVQNVKRRGRGWLAGMANIGWCTRLGWFNGFRLLVAVNPEGMVTGFGFGEGSAKDQPLTETLLALRQHPESPLPSVGLPALGPYVVDTGFEGEDNHRRWRLLYSAEVVCKPKSNSRKAWPKAWRRWLHSIRQIVESVYAKLMDFFRLDKERPHTLAGFQASLAAKVALHNFCIWLNKPLSREALAFADLLGW